MPRRAALLRGFSSSGINRYVDVIMPRTAEEGKLRLPLRYSLQAEARGADRFRVGDESGSWSAAVYITALQTTYIG